MIPTQIWKKTTFGDHMQLEYVGMSKPGRLSAKAHSHEQWELIYNAQGSGSMTVGNETHPYTDTTVLLCPPGLPHSKVSESGFTDYYFRFTGCDLPPCAYVVQDSYDRRLLRLLQVLHSTYYEGNSPAVCDHLMEAILGLLKPMLGGSTVSEYVQMLRQRIAEGYTDPDFSLAAAMASAPLNRDHLRRLFVQQLGQTPHEYLTALRIDKAKLLLSQGNTTVSDVAYRCGFYDRLYFSKVFRKATGVTPSQWR